MTSELRNKIKTKKVFNILFKDMKKTDFRMKN